MYENIVRAGGSDHFPGGKTGYMFSGLVPVRYNPVAVGKLEPVVEIPDDPFIGINFQFRYICHTLIIEEEVNRFHTAYITHKKDIPGNF